MKMVNVHEAKTRLSHLLARAARGEEIIIAKAGKPIARLVPIENTTSRRFGLLPGLKVGDEFFEPLPDDQLADWEK
jgi:prevent-host-death family protein